MQAKDLIKELDPEYVKCYLCKRLIHITQLTDNWGFGIEKNALACENITSCDNRRNNLWRHQT